MTIKINEESEYISIETHLILSFNTPKITSRDYRSRKKKEIRSPDQRTKHSIQQWKNADKSRLGFFPSSRGRNYNPWVMGYSLRLCTLYPYTYRIVVMKSTIQCRRLSFFPLPPPNSKTASLLRQGLEKNFRDGGFEKELSGERDALSYP